MRTKVYMQPGDKVQVKGNYSEVMCHFGLAGKMVQVELIRREYGTDVYHSAQVYVDNRPFSGTITTGEAGIYHDDDGYYTYVDADDVPDENPKQVMQDIHKMLDDAIASTGVKVTVITDLGL